MHKRSEKAFKSVCSLPQRLCFIAALGVVFPATFTFAAEDKVYTDSDLINYKKAPMVDEESARRAGTELESLKKLHKSELESSRKQREDEDSRKPAVEEQKKIEQETRAVWENMIKALQGR